MDTADVDWASVRGTYGPAREIPALLERIRRGRASDVREALDRLWQEVDHQDTVSEATPLAVPLIAELIGDAAVDSAVRLRLLFLLAAIGCAESAFGSRRAEIHGRGGSALPAGEPDLVEASHKAVALVAGRLGALVAEPRLRTGAVALLASARQVSPEVRAELQRLTSDPGPLGGAAGLVLELVDGREPDVHQLQAAASREPDVLDFLEGFEGTSVSPVTLARLVVWELASAVTSDDRA